MMGEIALAIRVLLALVFMTAAAGKWRHRDEFQGVVANYRLLPEQASVYVARWLPGVEAAVAAGLLFAASAWPALAAAGLLLLFAAAMAINILRGRRQIDCGCFQGALKQPLSWLLVARNATLALLLGIPALLAVGPLSVPAAAEAIATGVVLFVLLQSMNLLWSLVPAWRQRRA